MQEGSAADLIWPIAYLLADLSRLITLEPGDVVLTGTPANSRPMEPGDTVAVEVSGPRPAREPRGGLGRRPVRAGRAAAGVGADAARGAAMPEDEAERAVAAGEPT